MGAEYQRPSLPAAVERQLRQEAGFGCSRCGHPYIEFHHIIPVAEEQHNRPEDMVALCGNCHPAVEKLGRDRQHEIKHNPHNVQRNLFKGALEFDKRDLIFKVGGNWYVNTPTILQYDSLPIISCSLKEGQAKVSLNLLGADGSPMLTVYENDVCFRVSNLWDFEYAHNYAIVRHGPRDIALRMDFRNAEATIEGRIWLGGSRAVLGRDEMAIPGYGAFRGCSTSNCPVGIQIDRHSK
jgi:hypothetical protein